MTKLDDMLKEWPMRESTQLEVDESAERVTAALSAGQMPASIDESILAPPLPKTSDEGQTSAPRVSGPAISAVENKMSKDRTRDRTSFQELAKLATTPPPPTGGTSSAPASISGAVVRGKEADSSDSGIVDLKMMATMDPTASERAQSTPLAASGLFEDESAPPKPAVSAAVAQQALSSAPASSAAPAVAQAAASSAKASVAPKKTEEKKGGGGIVIVLGALVAAAAIAAGGFFFIKHQRAAKAVASGPAATATATVAATAKATATAIASVAITDTQEQGNDIAVDPSQAGKPSMGKYHAKSGGPATTAAGNNDTQPAPTGTIDPKLIANIPTGGAGGSGGDLQEAMKTAAGGGTGLGAGGGGGGSTTQAAGNVAQRPSQGQVAGAIGSVMPAAKACLNGDEPMSRATVTFQSDGTVKSVNVTGFAAGKPQEACIKTALSKATVSPFAEATYPVPVTIRSN